MSTPFDDLPALTRPAAAPAPASASKRERSDKEEQEQEEQQEHNDTAAPETKKKPRREPEEKQGTEEEQQKEQERNTATKKPRREQEEDHQADDDHNDPVAAALARLTPHLRSSARIAKAGPLLRTLLDGDGAAVAEPRHAPLTFAAVAAAFADPAQFLAAPPAARVEYARVARSAQRAAAAGLFDDEEGVAAASAARAFFSECVGAWAQLRLELLSAEDSFALSKALGKLKALVDGVPEWEEGDEVEEEEEGATGAEATAAVAPAPAAATAKPRPPPPPITWPPSPARVLLLRRRAALDCALCARDHVHGRAGAPWAAAAVEPALEHVASAAASARFAPGLQRREAQALAGWVSARRAARRTGAGGAGGAAAVDDRGAFERARASFARMGDVSARGSVGNKGGASLPWLG
jgi:hypothetical protein